MSRFGWAYVSDVITGSGGTPGGSDKAIQFASGSAFSGSTNFTFDYNTNTVRLTGTLYADNLIVSSSQILKSGSTIFGDDLLDTHQFTGSVYVTGVVSSSTGIQSAGAITSQGIISSSLGFQTNTTVEAAGNITSQAIISSSNGFQTNSTIDAVGNIRTTNGDLSSSIGIQTGGFLTVAGATNLKSGLTVTGSSFVQALSSSGQIQATSFAGNGLNIIGVQATNVDGAGDDWAVQFKNGNTGTLTGSSNLLFSGSTLTLTGSLLMSGTSYISEVDYIDFDVAASTPSYKNGRVFWNNTDGCLNVYNAEADVTLQVGQESWTRIRNNTGTTITNGTVVRIIGAQGDAPTIVRAQSITKSGSINVDTQILGVATHDIEDSSFGYVTTQGLVRGLNTNAFAEGETLFVGTGSAGVLENTAPVAPYEIIPVGVCVKAGPGTSGIIYVAVQQPIDFPDLSSVFVSGNYAYGDIWTYVSSSNTGYWIHTNTLSGSYTITGSLTLTGTLSGTTAQFTTISGSTVTGSTALFTTITASDYAGIQATSVVGADGSGAIQYKNPSGGTLTGSTNLTFNGSTLSITGSAIVSGSSGLTVIGPTVLSGNVSIASTNRISSSNFVGNGSNLTNVVPSFSTKQITTVYPMGGDTSFCILGLVPTPIKQTGLSAYYNTTNGTGGGTEYTIDTNGIFARLKTRAAASLVNTDATTIKINAGVASSQIASGSQIATLTTVLKTDTVINDQIITFGFTNFDNFNNGNGAIAANKSAFINYDPSGSLDTTWKLVTINGSGAGAKTRADTGVTVSTGSIYNVAITLSGTEISCNINGTITTASATKPDGLMAPTTGILLVSGSVQRSLYTKGFELIQNF